MEDPRLCKTDQNQCLSDFMKFSSSSLRLLQVWMMGLMQQTHFPHLGISRCYFILSSHGDQHHKETRVVPSRGCILGLTWLGITPRTSGLRRMCHLEVGAIKCKFIIRSQYESHHCLPEPEWWFADVERTLYVVLLDQTVEQLVGRKPAKLMPH